MSEQEEISNTPLEETPEQSPEQNPYSLLAKETFRHNFHGDVKEVETPAKEEADKAETSEQEEPHEEQEEQQTQEAEESVIESVDELIDYMRDEHDLEVDSEWFENLKIPAKVNGNNVQYSLKELKDAAQKVQAADSYLDSAKEESKAQREALEQYGQALNQHITQTAELTNQAEQLLQAEAKSIDWQTLKEEDSAEFAAKKLEFQERQQQINWIKQQAAQKYQQWTQSQQQQYQETLKEQVNNEMSALIEKVPEWQDPKKAEQEQEQLRNYLTGNLGLSNEEVQSISAGPMTDHRLILTIRKAMLYDQQQTGDEVKKKKIAKIPKTMKPGASRTTEQANQEELDKSRQKLQKSGKLDDAYEFLKKRRSKA